MFLDTSLLGPVLGMTTLCLLQAAPLADGLSFLSRKLMMRRGGSIQIQLEGCDAAKDVPVLIAAGCDAGDVHFTA